MSEMISATALAEIKGCSLRYIQQLAKNGKLPSIEKADAANNRKEYLFDIDQMDEKSVSDTITPSAKNLK